MKLKLKSKCQFKVYFIPDYFYFYFIYFLLINQNFKNLGTCQRCGYISSNELCKACVLLEGLNRGLPKLGVGKTKQLVFFLYFYFYFFNDDSFFSSIIIKIIIEKEIWRSTRRYTNNLPSSNTCS